MKLFKNKLLVLSFLLAIITFGAYQQVLKNEFVDIDDPALIINNHWVTDQSLSMVDVLHWNLFRAHYKPLTALSWRAEYALVGEDPFLYHLNNLLLHIANTLFLFFIGLKLFSQFFGEKDKILASSFMLALLFALHPMHVESVAWAVERKDVLFSFFYLGSWLAYLQYLQKEKYTWLVFTAIFYFLSMMSKSMGITLVAVLFLTDLLYKRKISFRLLYEKIPVAFVFLAGTYLYGFFNDFTKDTIGLTHVASKSQASNYDTLNLFSPLIRRIVTIFLRFTLWFAHVLVPIKSALIYPKNDILDFFGKALLVFPFLVGGLYTAALVLRKKLPAFFWGLLFFAATISPAIAISDSGTAVFLPDRYLYIPLIGILFFLVVAIMKLYGKFKNAALVIFALVGFWYAWISIDLTKVWQNTGTLWSRPIELYSCNAEILNARANYYKKTGDDDKYLADINASISCDSTLPQPYFGRAMYYFNNNEFEKSLADFNAFVKHKGSGFNAEVFSNRGAAYFSIGETEKALADFNRAIELDSNYFFVYKNRAVAYKGLNRHDEAIKDWTTCIRFQPDNYAFYTERGMAYFSKRMFQEASDDFTKALALMPGEGTLYVKRAISNFYMNNLPQARTDVQKAIEMGVSVRQDLLRALGIN